MGASRCDRALAVPATPASAVDGPAGFDPSREEPFYGFEWIGEFFVADLREAADGLRRKADFFDGKANLLEQQMRAGRNAFPRLTEHTDD